MGKIADALQLPPWGNAGAIGNLKFRSRKDADAWAFKVCVQLLLSCPGLLRSNCLKYEPHDTLECSCNSVGWYGTSMCAESSSAVVRC